ncbi:hypothetical protein [Acidithiobacillus ferriphilus]|uniref:Uncharacterized protein n=1 Tax=Acidithiobacillus ferriphilus TaxID=1689834 RepID=A0ABU6FSU0_9PROT|nr:hypothetical protein [Acidithiobacillus ferriphilus]MEB8515135.1 hypothetical protein [Acidithiobacillus ferriphilus]
MSNQPADSDGSDRLEAIQAIITDPTASDWLKTALASALRRDPVDAVNDAQFLLTTLTDRLDDLIRAAPL